MKQASEKAGRAEAGTRSSSLRTLTATELGDGSQVFSGGRGGVGTRTCTTATLGTGSRKLCALLQDPQPLWISSLVDRLSPAPHPVTPSSGLWALRSSQGWKKGSAAGLQPALRPGDPSYPPATPSPPCSFCPPPLSPGSRLGPIRSLQPPESLGGRAGGCSPPPPPRRGSPRRGHPGAEANRPPPPACAICRLSASLRGPRSQAPAGVGSC